MEASVNTPTSYSPETYSQDEMQCLERLLLDFEVVKKAVEFHPDFGTIVRDYPVAEAGIRRSSLIATEAWQAVILSKSGAEPEALERYTARQLDKVSSLLSVSVYVLSHWLRILEGDTLPVTRVLN